MSSGLTGRYSASLSDITSSKGTKSPQREAKTNDRKKTERDLRAFNLRVLNDIA